MAGKVPETSTDKTKAKKLDQPGYDLFTFKTDGNTLTVVQHGDDALKRIYGSESAAVNEGLFMQGYMTLKVDETQAGTKDMRGFLPAIVRDIAPRDGVERMLAVQMAATHIALVRQGGRMANAEHLPQFEAHERAYLTRRKYLKDYDRPGTAGGWHFVISRNERDIKRLADVVGFGYRYEPQTKLYNHVAVLMICSPEGTVSRYLGKIPYNPQTLRLSLAEAAEGKVGSAMDQFLLYCFHYDSSTGRYGPAAFRIMRVGGVLTVLLLGGVLSIYWLREKRKKTKTRCETD